MRRVRKKDPVPESGGHIPTHAAPPPPDLSPAKGPSPARARPRRVLAGGLHAGRVVAGRVVAGRITGRLRAAGRGVGRGVVAGLGQARVEGARPVGPAQAPPPVGPAQAPQPVGPRWLRHRSAPRRPSTPAPVPHPAGSSVRLFEDDELFPRELEAAVPDYADEEFLGTLSADFRDLDEPVIVVEPGWAATLRRFGRLVVWALPLGALLLALSGMWGWPTPTTEPVGPSPGTWLVFTVFGLLFALVGVLALTALLSTSPGRMWAMLGLGTALAGTVLLVPVLGVMGLARPAMNRLDAQLGPQAAAQLESRLFGGSVSRWLGVGGLILLSIGCLALGCAVLASRLLNRIDGYLLFGVVGVVGAAAYQHWQFLVVIAAMLLLAAGLGLAFTASRLTPDGAAVRE